MRQLQRGQAPICLAGFRSGLDTWTDVTQDHKAEIWRAIDVMQGGRCAYCEAAISGSDKHIEHFRQRSRFQEGTFSWSNLFGSCNRINSCGKHKDDCGTYDPSSLIKPDVEDPEHFFVYVSDGTIAVRKGLGVQDTKRAQETLRIFNLDAQYGPLRRMRQQAVAGYLQTADELRELAGTFPPEDWIPLLQSELAAIENLPFCTAIKHALLP